MMYLGDYAEDDTVYFLWSSNAADGASITRSTDGTIHVYKNVAGGTEVTTGITDVEDFDSLTGIHSCTIDLSSAAFYAVGGDYSVVLKAATIDGQTVNAVLAHFSIENRFTDASDVTAIKAVTDVIPDAGALTALLASIEYLQAFAGYWTTVSDTSAGTIVVNDSAAAELRTITITTDGTERTMTGS